MVPRKVLARAAGDSWGDYLKYLRMDLRKVEAGEEIGTLRSGGGGGGEVEAWKTLGAHMYPPGPLRPAPILCRDATSHVPNAVTWRESGLIAGASLSAVAITRLTSTSLFRRYLQVSLRGSTLTTKALSNNIERDDSHGQPVTVMAFMRSKGRKMAMQSLAITEQLLMWPLGEQLNTSL